MGQTWRRKDFKSLPALGTTTLRTFPGCRDFICCITAVSDYSGWAVKSEPDDLLPEFEGLFSSPFPIFLHQEPEKRFPGSNS